VPQTHDRSPARRVLIIGGAGYLGSVLVRRLLALGRRVHCLDALLYGNGAAIAPLFDHPLFSFARADMRDAGAVASAIEDATDVVLLASLVGDPICRTHPALARDINVEGSLRALDAVRASRAARFVFASTCSNYGVRGDEPAAEHAALNPQSLYAETKVTLERAVLDGGAGDSIPTVLRLATAFGLSPRMRFDLTVSEFAREVALGRELTVYDADTWRPYCHVDDIAGAIVAVLEADPPLVRGEVFNVGGDALNATKRTIAGELGALVPGARVVFQNGRGDPRNYRVSFDKIRRTLGFVPRHTIREAMQAVVGAVRAGVFEDVDARPAFYANRLSVREPYPE